MALDELVIFVAYGNFPKRLFRAVEVLEVGKNMQKITFLLFEVGIRYGVRKMTAWVWCVFLVCMSTFPEPYFSL